jgi:hypothetical protein
MAALFVGGYPPVNFGLQHFQRYGAVPEHLVVELRDLELRAQRLLARAGADSTILSWPILYASAWPGMAEKRSASDTARVISDGEFAIM